jgi:hypothetical protein
MGAGWIVVALMGAAVSLIYLVFDIVRTDFLGETTTYSLYLLFPMIALSLWVEASGIYFVIAPTSKLVPQRKQWWVPFVAPGFLFRMIRQDQLAAIVCWMASVACLTTAFIFPASSTYFRMLLAASLVFAPCGLYFLIHWLLLPEVPLDWKKPLMWTIIGQVQTHDWFIWLVNKRKGYVPEEEFKQT